ncbi:hypothetical protein ABTE32_23025, partial [Acinetobacter baumannii]
LNRSFSLTVDLPDSLASASAAFFHSSEWSFAQAQLPEAEPQVASIGGSSAPHPSPLTETGRSVG